MLSYQHAYHAGALADVHKHAALTFVLDYLTKKDKPLTYFETHAGRGLYDLASLEAQKTGEATEGISKVETAFPSDHPYRHVLDLVRSKYGGTAYPGSPLIAATMLRAVDTLHLAELHPQEHAALLNVMRANPLQVHKTDGFAMALSRTPPEPRRGLMLIDPSFEVKAEYEATLAFLTEQHRKWNVGVLILWYPVLKSGLHIEMAKALDSGNFAGAVHHQLSFPPAKADHGMIGSGLFIVNAPFGLADELERIAGYLAAGSRR